MDYLSVIPRDVLGLIVMNLKPSELSQFDWNEKNVQFWNDGYNLTKYINIHRQEFIKTIQSITKIMYQFGKPYKISMYRTLYDVLYTITLEIAKIQGSRNYVCNTSVEHLMCSMTRHPRIKLSHKALYYAVDNNEPHFVDFLLNSGFTVDRRISFQDETALILASKYGYKEIVELLLMHEADINIKNSSGETALVLATQHGKSHIVNILLNNGANNNDINEALLSAVNRSQYYIVKILLAGGGNVNICDRDGNTILNNAVQFNDYSMTELLLQSGANYKITNKHNWTPLTYASKERNMRIVKLLKNYGAKPYDGGLKSSIQYLLWSTL